jgi:hypothetical protein
MTTTLESSTQSPTSSSKVGVVAGVIISVTLVVGAAIAVFLVLRNRNKNSVKRGEGGTARPEEINAGEVELAATPSTPKAETIYTSGLEVSPVTQPPLPSTSGRSDSSILEITNVEVKKKIGSGRHFEEFQ